MIRLDAVRKRFAHGEAVLEDVSVAIPRGARWGLIGPAACGKSVLLKLLVGLLRPDGGAVVVDGHDVARASEDSLGALRARVGMLFQNYALFDFMTVAENVAFPLA